MTPPPAKYLGVIVRLDRTIQCAVAGVSISDACDYWMPAFAGMTRNGLKGHQ